ncbi:hypothetical protein [Streptomyces mirabilis]|uniref:hypothetical protein n=1 Tax=Streptomyces mirabilis TaxID=68239 RepID=UPI00331ECF3E
MDTQAHDCLPATCRMRFIPRSNAEGWDGILTVTTTRAAPEALTPQVRRARPFVVLGESQAADGPVISNSLCPLPRAHGHVLQLECPPMSRSPYTPWQFAQLLGAVWALHGDQVLIIRCVFSTVDGWKRDPFSDWPRTRLPEAPTAGAPWQPMRLVPGSGALYLHQAFHSFRDLENLVARARDHFDWIILADDIDHHMCPDFLDGIADDYLLVTEDCGYRTSLSVSHPRHSPTSGQGIPLSPAEAAVVWREQTLRFVPVDRVPVSGLLLMATYPDGKQRRDTFAAEADRAVARLGTPILGRFAAGVVAHHRNVLGQAPELADSVFTAEAQAVADRLREASPCSARMTDGATVSSA